MRSGWVILNLTSGETPIAAIADVATCILSSLIFPCSQSIMMPLDHNLSFRVPKLVAPTVALTSSPVAATTCAVRKDGSPMKVRTGFAFDLRAFKTRKLGLCCAILSRRFIVIRGLLGRAEASWVVGGYISRSASYSGAAAPKLSNESVFFFNVPKLDESIDSFDYYFLNISIGSFAPYVV